MDYLIFAIVLVLLIILIAAGYYIYRLVSGLELPTFGGIIPEFPNPMGSMPDPNKMLGSIPKPKISF